jgi:hypothetical protein
MAKKSSQPLGLAWARSDEVFENAAKIFRVMAVPMRLRILNAQVVNLCRSVGVQIAIDAD